MVGDDLSSTEGFTPVGCPQYSSKVHSAKKERLAALIVQPLAVVAEPIAARAVAALIRRYVVAEAAQDIIVIYAIWSGLVGLIN
jgi:hypothetical protein